MTMPFMGGGGGGGGGGGVAKVLHGFHGTYLSSEKTSGKIDHVLQSDWSMKMAQCKSRQPFLCDFSNLCFAYA